jgi:hypothetical protein
MFMELNRKILAAIIIAIPLILSVYFIFFATAENIDNQSPKINTITGNVTGKKDEKITITMTFSDNIEVTNATLYYKTPITEEWSYKSILSGSTDILLNSNEGFYYYVTVDDAAGNGPVGDPSTDGSVYYTITVLENDDNGSNDEYIRKVFLEEGAFTTCQYCPLVAKMLYELYSSGDYNFNYVTLVEVNDIVANRLRNEYNLYGLPTVYIDGGYRVIMGGTNEKSVYTQAIQEAEKRSVPDIQVKVTAEYDNNTNTLISNVVVKNKEDKTYNGRLRVYLTEKVSRWSGPEGEPYHFGFLDYIINEEISIEANETVSFNESWDLSDLDPENLMVMAVVFNSEKKQGYSKPPDENPFDAYYADAVEAAEVIEGGNLPPTVGFSLPEIGKLHIFGTPIYKFKFHKTTVLVGKTKVVANAEDDKGIEKVEFYINGNLVYEDTEGPYEYSFSKVKLFKRFVRKYTISVIAYDDEGKTGTGSIEVIAFLL